MNIDTSVINNINSNTSTAGLSTRQSAELRESFMTLLITQLQNQDPLNPMENSEMTSQLAQINTVSGIEELNATLNGITQQMDAAQTLQAAGLIDFFAARGISADQQRACLSDTAKIESIANNSSAQAQELGINSTPTFILNGEKVNTISWQSLEPMLQRAGARTV